jgi:hypothetical protein
VASSCLLLVAGSLHSAARTAGSGCALWFNLPLAINIERRNPWVS